jgi:hypothetical protein
LANGNPSLVLTNGTLTLGNNPVTITVSGSPLAAGSYLVISNAGGVAPGSVSGSVSSSVVTVNGAGVAAGNGAFLQLSEAGVNLVATQPPFLSGAVKSGASVQLTFSGPNGQTFTVLTSTNLATPLINWSVAATGAFGSGPANFTDNSLTNQARFYSIHSP